MIDLENIFQRYRPELEAELKRIVGKASLPMYDMMRYHMGWIEESGHTRRNTAGKRLRPILCLLACESLNGQWRQALPVAASIELVHNFSLIHDDIQDSSRERRGRPTVWSIWGLPQGINAGDGMHALALSSLLRLEERGIPHEKTVRAAGILGEASLRLCEGQYLDLSYVNRLNIKVKDYLAMISGKTAALFRCSLEVGSLMATDDESVITRMRKFGHALGMTFQVHDDILSIWGDVKATGKPIASDIQMRKKTLPVLYALSKAKGEDRERLIRTYKRKRISYADVDEVLKLLDKLDAKAYAQEMSTKYYNDALTELNGLDISQTAKAELEAVAAFLFDRKF